MAWQNFQDALHYVVLSFLSLLYFLSFFRQQLWQIHLTIWRNPWFLSILANYCNNFEILVKIQLSFVWQRARNATNLTNRIWTKFNKRNDGLTYWLTRQGKPDKNQYTPASDEGMMREWLLLVDNQDWCYLPIVCSTLAQYILTWSTSGKGQPCPFVWGTDCAFGSGTWRRCTWDDSVHLQAVGSVWKSGEGQVFFGGWLVGLGVKKKRCVAGTI